MLLPENVRGNPHLRHRVLRTDSILDSHIQAYRSRQHQKHSCTQNTDACKTYRILFHPIEHSRDTGKILKLIIKLFLLRSSFKITILPEVNTRYVPAITRRTAIKKTPRASIIDSVVTAR